MRIIPVHISFFTYFTLTLSFLILKYAIAQEDVTDTVTRLKKICDICTCSEIPDVDGTHLVLNIQCSELDRIETLADLDKIEWPANPNGLKMAATFEGLGFSTLGKLPPNSQMETLQFINNDINTYWPDPFSDVPNLKKLSFSQNELPEITPDLFTNLERLEDLDLSYNKLVELSAMDFKNAYHVRRLNLQNNLLKNIPVDAVQPMTVLEDLDLSKNNIVEVLLLRIESTAFKSIRRLNLNGNRIRSITKKSFPKNNNIELLDLSNNTLEVVEESAFLGCSSLKELNLAQNKITYPFSMPSTLQIVILKMNTLYNWPAFPSSITYIDLSYNRLSALYDAKSSEFDNLEVLNIGGNRIEDFQIQRKLPKLFSLDISYNLIPDVPECLNNQILPNLEELRLDGNPLKTIYFKNIIALKRLYMNDFNDISVVEDKAFSNVIERNVDGTSEEKSCFFLYLSNCPSLSSIQEGAFDGTSLCALDISKNNLSSLPKTLLNWSSVSEGVDLQYNPWHCSCDLQWVLDVLVPLIYSVDSRLLSELRCASPRAYARLRLVHWYNWTEQAMCKDLYMRGGPYGTDMVEESRELGPKVTSLTVILGCAVIVALLVAIALSVYVVKTRRRYRRRKNTLQRKRQETSDFHNINESQKEQINALN